MKTRLKVALLLAFCLHGALILAQRYQWSYDAYVHMFFADHYRLNWWSLWEPRWYGGFTVASYPPLVHQLIALLSFFTGIQGAFALVLLAVGTILPLAVYAFARIFTSPTVSGHAALISAVIPSVYLTAYTFGQLPTLAGLAAVLILFARLAAFLKHGRLVDAALACLLAAVTAALHHGTLLLFPWGIAAVTANLVLTRQVAPARVVLRLSGLLPPIALGIGIVVWPFWQWGMGESMQIPIDHLSRHNFLFNLRAQLLFFWPVYGPLVAGIPYVFRRLFAQKSVSLAGLFVILFVLGLGGTTPLPQVLFGPRWAWLTYDRFALWASITMLPLLGEGIIITRRAYRKYIRHKARISKLPSFQGFVFGSLFFAALSAAFLPSLVPTQPARLDLEPVAAFLNRSENDRWRYLTLGFGDQMARLSLLTPATTIDGSYHTARPVPELRRSGVGQIDSAYWMPSGFRKLEPILEMSGSYGVRWAFVHLPAYRPLLQRHGWVQVTTLSNGVLVYENKSAMLPVAVTPVAPAPLAALSWGSLPLMALAAAFLLGWISQLSHRQVYNIRVIIAKVFLALHHGAVGLLPLAICFPYFRRIVNAEHPRVYFTYDNALFYLSDGIILAAVAAWLAAWILRPHAFIHRGPRAVTWSLLSLVILSWLSLTWSAYPLGSIYYGLHLGLMFGLYLSLLDRPRSWFSLATGSVFALGVEATIAILEFVGQSTAFLEPLDLLWPGTLVPSIRGASVVELLDGARWLRAYGTLPHPNLLGGIILACLAALMAFFLGGLNRFSPIKTSRLKVGDNHKGLNSLPTNRLKNFSFWIFAALFGLGMVALVLTFSRSAWIGFFVGGVVLLLLSGRLSRLSLKGLAGFAGIALAATVIPLRTLVYTRVAGIPVHTEIRSISERLLQYGQALEMIERQPWNGTGIGGYLVTLAKEIPGDWWVEPVHNMYILAAAELGLPGALILAGLIVGIILYTGKVRTADGAALSAVLLGLLCIGLFDHYLWSLPIGRTLIWSIMGAWAGQLSLASEKDEKL